MTVGQDIFALVYVVVGLVLAVAPIIYLLTKHNAELRDLIEFIPAAGWLALACILVMSGIFILDGREYLIGSIVVGLAVAGVSKNDRLRAFLLTLAAVGAAGTLLWWKYDDAHKPTIETKDLAYYFAATIGILLVALVRIGRNTKINIFIALVIAAVVLQHSLNMSVLLEDGVYSAVRHHWGAYIGPSETLLSGARLLYDIPAQYGFGPTLLIASACGKNCWVGMYWITTAASVVYALLIVASASVIARRLDSSWTYAATMLAAASACLLWSSYPPQLGAPWSYPSTGGLRFIPLAALLLFILWRESRAAEARPSRLFGHLIWCFGAVWAPEAAFYLSLVWWPYLLWRAGHLSLRPLRAAALAGLEIIAVACALAFVFISLFYLIYGVLPSLDVYAAYVVNPTGPLPPNPLGSIWFFVFTMVAGIAAAVLLIRNRDAGPEFASLFVCILALFGVFSYYVGRSHDNNILNIMPFLVLVLASVQSFAPLPALSQSARAALASTLACVLFFGWSAWRQTSLSDYANADLAASMSYYRGATAEQTGAATIPSSGAAPAEAPSGGQIPERSRVDGANPADAARAVFYVSQVRGEPLIKIDDGLDIAPIGPRAWSAIHDPIDFYFLPDALVAKLIDRTMRQIKSPGWLVIAKHVDSDPETQRWQRLLEASYAKGEEKDFGAYHAIRYEPNLR